MVRIITLKQQNFLCPIQFWSTNLKKIAVRSSLDPAKIGFSPNLVRYSPDPCSSLVWRRTSCLQQCWTWSGFRIAIQPDSANQNRIRIGLDIEKKPTGSEMDIQSALITAVKCLVREFFGYKPDWIKYFESATGLRLDWIAQRHYWTGLVFQKSPIRSTLVCALRSKRLNHHIITNVAVLPPVT